MTREICVHETEFNGNNSFAYGSGWKKTDLGTSEQFGAVICGMVWSPCLWKGGIRKKENFAGSFLCVLDFDKGVTLEKAYEMFEPYTCVIGITKSHTEAEHRFRVILVFSEAITDARTYEYNMRRYVNMFGSDPHAVDCARMFYPCKEIVCQNRGDTMPVFPIPKPPKVFKPKEKINKVTGEITKQHYDTKAMRRFEDFGAYDQGDRNDLVFSVALHRAHRDFSLADTITYMTSKTSLPEAEAIKTIESAYKFVGK